MPDAHCNLRPTSVYFIRFGEFGPIKIGKSNRDLRTRLSIIQLACPEQVYLIATIPDPPEELREAALHRRFVHLRIRGEWYESTLELTNFIAQHADPVPHEDRVPRPRGRVPERPLYECETWGWANLANGKSEEKRALRKLIVAFRGKPSDDDTVCANRVRRLRAIALKATGHWTAMQIAALEGVSVRTIYDWQRDIIENCEGSTADAIRVAFAGSIEG